MTLLKKQPIESGIIYSFLHKHNNINTSEILNCIIPKLKAPNTSVTTTYKAAIIPYKAIFFEFMIP